MSSTMDIDYYKTLYKINEYLLCCIGYWPHQSKFMRRMISSFLWFSIISLFVPQTLAIIEHWNDMEIIIHWFPSYLVSLMSLNYLIACSNKDNIEELLLKMKKDWFIWKSEREIKILYENAHQGRMFIIVFLVVICVCWFEFLVESISPVLLDIIIPLNQSRPKKINLGLEYYVNQEDNYFWITLHICHTNTVMITIIVGTDAIFMAFLYHACGEFAILGFKLKNIGKKECNEWNTERNKMQEIKFCAEKHDSLLTFVNGICNCFSTRYFIAMGCTVILISSTGVELMMNFGQINMESIILRFAFCHLFHVFCINFSCQRLTDHSFELFRNIYDGYWYELSNNDQKMILMIMMRSIKLCKFTGAKLHTFTISNFATILNKSLYYYNILKSLTTIKI